MVQSGSWNSCGFYRHWCLYISASGTGASLQHRVYGRITHHYTTHTEFRVQLGTFFPIPKCTAAKEREGLRVWRLSESFVHAQTVQRCILSLFITLCPSVIHRAKIYSQIGFFSLFFCSRRGFLYCSHDGAKNNTSYSGVLNVHTIAKAIIPISLGKAQMIVWRLL